MTLNEWKKIFQEKGIAGAGGAGFPAYAKLSNKIQTIILNCAECEPLLKVHRQLLMKYTVQILRTLQSLADCVGADSVIIAVKESYKETVQELKSRLQSSSNNMELRYLKEAYPVGDEVILIYETTGKVVSPGSIPIEHGIAVFNVETVYNMYRALEYGEPVIEKYLTIAGEVNQPVTVKVPVGVKIKEVIKLAGNTKVSNPQFIMGGPMTGKIVNDSEVITKTSNAVLVLPEDHFIIRKKRSKPSIQMKRAMSSCCQCQMCTDLCPRNLLGHPIEPHAFMRSATSGMTRDVTPFVNTLFCSECGLCEMYSCVQNLSPRTLISACKAGLINKGLKKPEQVKKNPVSSVRNYRMVPEERLITHINLKQYDLPAPITEEEREWEYVKIPLSQHIGAPPRPVVKEKQFVKAGELLAESITEKLSLPIHASISGEVMEVNEQYISINKV